MEKRVLKQTAFVSILLSMGILIFLLEVSDLQSQGLPERMMEKTAVVLSKVQNSNRMETVSRTKKNDFVEVSLPAQVTQSDVTLSTDYFNHSYQFVIKNVKQNAITRNSIKGIYSYIKNVTIQNNARETILSFTTDEVYEPVWFLSKENKLYIKWNKPSQTYNKTVVIDAGHGGNDIGTSHFGVVEKEVNLKIALKLKQLLDSSDIKAYYTRTGDSYISLQERTDFANSVGADFFISIHSNGDKYVSSYGTEILYQGHGMKNESFSKSFASALEKELIPVLHSRDRGLVDGSNIFIIRNSRIPMALIETGFITNCNEALKLSNDNYQQLAAQGIFNGIKKAFEEEDTTIEDTTIEEAIR